MGSCSTKIYSTRQKDNWFYIPDNKIEIQELSENKGKWIFLFPISNMGDAWDYAKHIYNTQSFDLKLDGIKCLNYKLYSQLKEGVIIFMFDDSIDSKQIMQKGKTLLILMNYDYIPFITYKTMFSKYTLKNNLFQNKCTNCDEKINRIEDVSIHHNVCFECRTTRTIILDSIIQKEFIKITDVAEFQIL